MAIGRLDVGHIHASSQRTDVGFAAVDLQGSAATDVAYGDGGSAGATYGLTSDDNVLVGISLQGVTLVRWRSCRL